MMLERRYPWACAKTGCCVFVGGTEDYDIYMSDCDSRPWEPGVILVPQDTSAFIEYENVKHFAAHFAKRPYMPDIEAKLGRALTFVQCFFPTPEKVMMDKIARGEEP